MSNTVHQRPPEESATRFSFATLLSALVPALLATALVVFLGTRSHKPAQKRRADGLLSVTLSQKDSTFNPIPASAGGATGEVLYSPTGRGLHFRLEAEGLKADRRYALEIQVDDAIYSVASYATNVRGSLAIDSTITRFEEGICVGRNFDAPRAIAGSHSIKFWLKRDGSPASGTMPGVAPSAPGAQLLCHGNGDGNYDYVLLDNGTVKFTGTPGTGNDSAR